MHREQNAEQDVLVVFSQWTKIFNGFIPVGRIGELARVAVLVRKLPRRKGLWATLVGTVFAHRVFDIVPVLMLILYVVVTAKVPAWAISILLGIIGVGGASMIGMMSAPGML